MKKIFALLLLIISFCCRLCAQEQLSKQQLADRMFERGEYAKCLPLYRELAGKNNPQLIVSERVANCYRLINDYRNAEDWYRNVSRYSSANAIDTYYYAEALLANNKPVEARAQFASFYKLNHDTTSLKFKQALCDSAVKWQAGTTGYMVEAAGQFNTTASDWGLIYNGKNGFVFTSDRGAGGEVYDRTGAGYLQLYKFKDNLVTLLPMFIGSEKLFNGDYHIGPMAMNVTNDTAYLTVTTTINKNGLPVKRVGGSQQRIYERRLQLFMVTLKDGVWGDFVNFPYNNVTEYSIGHAALSADGNTIYFTGDMPGGMGGTDIWFCKKQADGKWGKPINCGSTINSKDDEAFPTINNGVLYYSSKGLPGMGGFDIFRAEGSSNKWSAPVNLRYPVNSTRDDFYYTTRDNIKGYLSSNRDDGRNDDIYSFKFTPVAPPQIITTTAIAVTKPGMVLSNIYYDLDKSNIRPDAAIELDKLVKLLLEKPALVIQLASYTDSRATKDYNVGLSERRSASAKAYLVVHGIAAGRLETTSFGENNPVNQCGDAAVCTEAQHQLNRRTEVSILR